jgi:phosphoglycolate phosphatase-like HAD superfamily hydrolase
MVSELKLLKKVKLFWDIDGTLLKTNGAAAVPFAKAVSNFVGTEIILDRKKLSGFTDFEIVINLLQSVGIKTSLKNVNTILECYAENLPASLKQGTVKKINSIDLVLESLSKVTQVELAIGTGNFLLGARIKLHHVRLIKYFSTNNIFCASDHYWSRDLIIENARNSLVNGQIGIVIGDSPKDIISAKNAGLKVISAPTGAHSQSELKQFLPDLILSPSWKLKDLIKGINNII